VNGLSSWWIVAAVTEGLAVAAWLVTLRTRQVRGTFIVGFNAILPVTLVHLLVGVSFHWRSALALGMVVLYLIRMNWVILGWTKHTAMAKLDQHLSVAQKHLLPFVMTNASGWLYCLPFYFVARRTGPPNWLDAAAVGMYAAGSLLHTTADLQKKRFKERADSAGRILDRGLWAWSRHPNYFGDFLVYVSWAMLAADPWAWVSPATNLLQYAFDAIPKSEAWATERYGAAWREYTRRTSRFVPLPPR
jgi:steroid 5-alpha reductase family enzyme